MARRTRHDTLVDLTRILYDHNPMNIPLGDPSEYEDEALSILSRYVESALHMCPDETMRRQISTGIVSAAFEFWFSEKAPQDIERVSFALLDSYVAGVTQA